jgi:hypothetical protein
MKTKSIGINFLLLAVLVVPVSFADDNMQMAQGHVEIHPAVFGTLVIDKYSFVAISHEDGRVSGEFEFDHSFRDPVTDRELNERVHGTVDCVTITGNRARVGGTVRHSKSPFIPEGSQLAWSVTDNGNNKDNPDTASEMLGGNAFLYCAFGLPFPESPLIHGNLNVRP